MPRIALRQICRNVGTTASFVFCFWIAIHRHGQIDNLHDQVIEDERVNLRERAHLQNSLALRNGAALHAMSCPKREVRRGTLRRAQKGNGEGHAPSCPKGKWGGARFAVPKRERGGARSVVPKKEIGGTRSVVPKRGNGRGTLRAHEFQSPRSFSPFGA